jgi:hypothetical protein
VSHELGRYLRKSIIPVELKRKREERVSAREVSEKPDFRRGFSSGRVAIVGGHVSRMHFSGKMPVPLAISVGRPLAGGTVKLKGAKCWQTTVS